jgi:hypothetical protein
MADGFDSATETALDEFAAAIQRSLPAGVLVTSQVRRMNGGPGFVHDVMVKLELHSGRSINVSSLRTTKDPKGELQRLVEDEYTPLKKRLERAVEAAATAWVEAISAPVEDETKPEPEEEEEQSSTPG